MKREEIKEISRDSLLIQNQFIEQVKSMVSSQERKKTYCIVTFGCQMNVHDSEKLSGMLSAMGYMKTEEETNADIVVYNTCCVRENAENRVYGKIGYLKTLKKTNKDLKIVLCGCMMQQDTVIAKLQKSYPFVDIIFGTYNLYRFPELLHTNLMTNHQVIDIWQEHSEIVEDLPSIREFSFKASVNIMFGCNNFCSYCIVPYVRGRERSRPPKEIVNEVETLAKQGVKEILLLGQNVNSYGLGLLEPICFADLLRLVAGIPGIMRIRFITSHPKDLSKELIDAMATLPNVCPHLHLPMQSGSSEVLKQMNRGYTKEHYLSLVSALREKIPHIAITTDIIVGFPGETQEDFEETLEVVKTVKFDGAFTFLYSKRTGTPAATATNQVDEAIAKLRFEQLLATLNPLVFEKNKEKEHTTKSVLVETIQDNIVTGRTQCNVLVHFEGGEELVGNIVDVFITEAKPFYLVGELLNQKNK